MNPTKEQKRIIEQEGNVVVNACPGSGKTFTISEKIRNVITSLEKHQGIVAISYTNKASDELKKRCTFENKNVKGSFFGTIHKFIDKEIIRKFYRHVFPNASKELEIERTTEFDEIYESVCNDNIKLTENENYIKVVEKSLMLGKLPLNYLIEIGCLIVKSSVDCQKYLISRYKYIFIDEYQDCNMFTHEIFKFLVKIGILGVAVGDLDQAIFNQSMCLLELWNDSDYTSLSLSQNHRCHKSIVDYSRRLMRYTYKCSFTDEKRVIHLHLPGAEEDVAKQFPRIIEKNKTEFNVTDYNKIAILTWSNRTAKLVSDNLEIKHKAFFDNDLDRNNLKWSRVFTCILDFYFDSQKTSFELASQYFHEEFEVYEFQKLIKLLNRVKELDKNFLVGNINLFLNIAELIEPKGKHEEAITLLKGVLQSEKKLSTYGKAAKDEVQIMTLHKSKGLEFDVMFHMDLNAWCFPLEAPNSNETMMRNLHYVGLTRAKKVAFLVTSTLRTNRNNEKIRAYPSKYLFMNDLRNLRLEIDETDTLENVLSRERYYQNRRGYLPVL